MQNVESGNPRSARLAERPISLADEKQIARNLSPSIAWPTLVLAITLPGAFALFVWLGMSKSLPLWVCAIALSYVSFAHYTLVHEAVHRNVIAQPKSLDWVNTIVGWIGACGLGIGWPLLQRTHVLHHSFVNTNKDPDISVKGTFVELVTKWIKGTPTSLVPPFAAKYISREGYESLEGVFSKRDIQQSSVISVFTLILLALSLATAHVTDWLFLLFIPQRVAVLILMIFFQWLPHHPFDRTDRYGATRISLWLGGDTLTFQQNLHLVHHMWPSVPFYNYRKLFEATKPILVFEGSRIEGFGVGAFSKSKLPE